MLPFLRFVAIAIGVVAAGFALAYLVTRNPKHLTIARRTFVGGVVTALIFFAVLFVERLLE